jgi:hypothetical protein
MKTNTVSYPYNPSFQGGTTQSLVINLADLAKHCIGLMAKSQAILAVS